MRCRLKIIDFEAFHYNGEPVATLPEWLRTYTHYSPMNGEAGIARNLVGDLLVPTLTETLTCKPGDWLVHGGKNLLSIVRAKDFDALYEAVLGQDSAPVELPIPLADPVRSVPEEPIVLTPAKAARKIAMPEEKATEA